MSTIPVTNWACRWALALRNAVSSTPTALTPARRSGSSTSGPPCSRTAAITVAHATPNAVATWATDCPSCPTLRHASTRARSVHDERGRTAGCCSVHVRTGQPGPWQRHTRLTHTRVTGRPPVGRSRTHTGRRACGRAAVPHEAHRAAVAMVSTACSSSRLAQRPRAGPARRARESPSLYYRCPSWAQAVVAFDLGVRWGRMPRRAQDVDQGRPGRDFPRVGRGSVVR